MFRVITVVLLFCLLVLPASGFANQCLDKNQRTAAQQSVFSQKLKRFRRSCKNAANPKRCRRKKVNRYCSLTRPGRDPELDGVVNRLDNCPNHINAGQEDADQDGIGNICEEINVIISDSQEDKVFIYKNVLETDLQSGTVLFADIRLGDPESGGDNDFNQPSDILVVGTTLIVGNSRNDRIHFFYDYENLANDAEPDVLLDQGNGSGVDNVRIATDGTDLYVSEKDDDEVTIFRDIATVETGDAPDVTIGGFSEPLGIAVKDDKIFVVDRETDTLYVFNNASTLVNPLTIADADVTITNNESGGPLLGETPRRVNAIGNRLFIHSKDGGDFDNDGRVAIYNDLTSLTDDQDPDTVIGETPNFPPIDYPHTAAILGDRLFIGNRDGNDGINVYNGLSGFGASESLVEFTLGFPEAIEHTLGLAASEATDVLIAPSEEFSVAGLYFNGSQMSDSRAPDVVFFDNLMDEPHTVLIVEK